MPETMTPIVSIVIASHRQNLIHRCLKGFAQGASGHIATEIIVVADYPIGKLEKDYPDVTWFFHDAKSIPAKRNAGISRARGVIVGFIDDDCLPAAGWVAQAVKYFEKNPLHAGVAGRTSVERAHGVSYPIKEYARLEIPGFRTNNIFYRKDVLDRVEGFDQRFVFQREDADVAFSIMSLGLCIGYCPDVQVFHLYRCGENWDLIKNCFNRRFDPLLIKKHPGLYRQWIKTPFTPGIAAVTALHAIFIASAWCCFSTGLIGAADLVFSLALSVRRNMQCGFHAGQIARDWLSYFVSPFVLLGALVYGSVKFKKVLIF